MLLKSIKSKILIFAITATLIPSLGLGFLSFRQNEVLIADNVTHELRALASYASRELELWIGERVHAVRALSTSNAIIDRLSAAVKPHAGKHGDRQALTHYLRLVREKLGALLELSVVDAAGQVVASSAATPGAITLPPDWHNAHPGSSVILPPHWDAQHAAATLTVAVPVLSYDNQPIGALVAVLDLRAVQPYLRSATESPPGEVLLLDPEGNVLLSSRSAATGPMRLDAELLRRLRAQPGEPAVFQGSAQREVIGLAGRPAALPVTIVAERDRAEVYGAWVNLRNLFLALGGALTLAVAVAAFRMGHSIVAPLQRLIDAAERIAGGDLEVRLAATQNDELGRLTRIFDQMADKLRHSHAEIVAANQAMQQQNRLLETLSVTDGLTGLYNRSKLDATLNEQFTRFQRNQRPFAVLMMDIDHFKTLNDSLGHIAGDEILTAVARILIQSVRSVDYAARYGGDEFTVVLVDTPAEAALRTAERIRSRVENMRYSINGQKITVTMSIGVVQCQSGDTQLAALIARADSALYEAKRAGRNRVHRAD